MVRYVLQRKELFVFVTLNNGLYLHLYSSRQNFEQSIHTTSSALQYYKAFVFFLVRFPINALTL